MGNFLDVKWLNSHPIAQLSIVITLGAISFFAVVPPQTLDFQNISWLQIGDPAQHYMGWAFFRDDIWRFPIGLNPLFGGDIASSIVFSDSIPLMAFLLKPFSSLLPQPFQYLGLWVLICFCLQAIFAFQLSKLITVYPFIRFAIVIIFIFSPPMLARYGETTALCAHFLILAALYLNLRTKCEKQSLWWALLLTISVLVNFYIFTLNLALWFSDSADRFRSSKISAKYFLMEFFAVSSLQLIVMWQAGYFSVPLGAASLGVYGADALNLNALFNSTGWSYVLPGSPYFYHAVAGFNFLGLGLMLTCPIAFIMAWRHRGCVYRHTQAHLFLIWVLLLIACFSISNSIHMGSLVVSFRLPTEFTKIAAIFRASGRMFWPVYYAIVFFCLYWTIKKLPPSFVRVLVYIIALIQVVDTSAGWLKSKAELNHGAQSQYRHINRFQNSFWLDAQLHYQQYRKLTPLNQSTDWESIAYLAQANKVATNSVYFARVNQGQLDQETLLNQQNIVSGKLDSSSLYILENKDVFRYLPYIKEGDLFAYIDGINVLAPNWYDCATCRSIAKESLIKHTITVFKSHSGFQFPEIATQLANYVFISGWARPEAWGIWSEGRYSEIALPGFLNQGALLSIKARALINHRHPNQVVEVFVNGMHNQRVILTKSENNQILITLPKSISSELRIGFAFSNPVSPQALGLSDDTRQLSIGITSLKYQLLD